MSNMVLKGTHLKNPSGANQLLALPSEKYEGHWVLQVGSVLVHSYPMTAGPGAMVALAVRGNLPTSNPPSFRKLPKTHSQMHPKRKRE